VGHRCCGSFIFRRNALQRGSSLRVLQQWTPGEPPDPAIVHFTVIAIGYTRSVYRRWLVLTLLLIMGLQIPVIGYAGTPGSNEAGARSGSSSPAAHTATPDSHDTGCCPYHSTHSTLASCLAHCAAMAAIVSVPLTLSMGTVRITLGPVVASSLPSEHPRPGLRPPIA
jgi:hypothetical protein